jgi:hypothetical protein
MNVNNATTISQSITTAIANHAGIVQTAMIVNVMRALWWKRTMMMTMMMAN